MKITIDININAAGLVEALRSFAGIAAAPSLNQPAPVQPTAPAAPVVPPAVPPAPPATPPAPAVPTSGQTYTMDQLAVAATSIIDAGRRQEVVSLLQHFGAASLTALPKEQYGAFATALRSMGAKL